jgi:hypothetical protein
VRRVDLICYCDIVSQWIVPGASSITSLYLFRLQGTGTASVDVSIVMAKHGGFNNAASNQDAGIPFHFLLASRATFPPIRLHCVIPSCQKGDKHTLNLPIQLPGFLVSTAT